MLYDDRRQGRESAREYSASCIDIVPALTAVQQREIGPEEAALGPADQEFHSRPDFVREEWDLGSCPYLVMDTGQIPGALPAWHLPGCRAGGIGYGGGMGCFAAMQTRAAA
jgi:hypothetical protein